jgi:hypothetical protein
MDLLIVGVGASVACIVHLLRRWTKGHTTASTTNPPSALAAALAHPSGAVCASVSLPSPSPDRSTVLPWGTPQRGLSAARYLRVHTSSIGCSARWCAALAMATSTACWPVSTADVVVITCVTSCPDEGTGRRVAPAGPWPAGGSPAHALRLVREAVARTIGIVRHVGPAAVRPRRVHQLG